MYLIKKKDKSGKRSMAEGREGYARLISKIALQHDEKLNKQDDASELEARLKYDSSLEGVRQAAIAFLERVSDTQYCNSVDCMTLTDRFAESLHSARNRNSDLDEAMKEVDEYNARFGPATAIDAVDSDTAADTEA